MPDPAPVASMTGSGFAAGSTALGELQVALRSVNGRGLQIKHRLCAELQGLESALEQRVRARLHRGSVTLTIERVAGAAAAAPEIDEDAAERAYRSLRALADRHDLRGGVTLSDLLAVPGVLTPATAVRRVASLPDDVGALLDTALTGLVEGRRAEGAATVAAMEELLGDLRGWLARARQRAPEVIDDYRRRLKSRVEEFLAGQGRPLEDADVLREVALFADRADVAEEVQRLDHHLRELGTLLARGGGLGRHADFLLQEMLREANTLGSKSQDVEMAHVVVELKAGIDRLKELAANLE